MPGNPAAFPRRARAGDRNGREAATGWSGKRRPDAEATLFPSTPRQIITPEQFDAIYHALPNADVQLLIETAVESGLRWGELTELRVRDMESEGLGPDELLFARRAAARPVSQIRAPPDPGTLGLTEPNNAGRQYRHVLHRYREKLPGWLVAAARIVPHDYAGDPARI